MRTVTDWLTLPCGNKDSVTINPAFIVSVVTIDGSAESCEIHLAGGHGYNIRASYQDVLALLEATQ